MTTLEEIEAAAEKLAPSEFDQLATWISNRYHERWKQKMDADATAGRLDFLFDEASTERAADVLRDWPSGKKE